MEEIRPGENFNEKEQEYIQGHKKGEIETLNIENAEKVQEKDYREVSGNDLSRD